MYNWLFVILMTCVVYTTVLSPRGWQGCLLTVMSVALVSGLSSSSRGRRPLSRLCSADYNRKVKVIQ